MLPNPRGIFGVHSVSPYSLADGTFYGTLKVVKDASMNFGGSTVALRGGSQKGPWAIEEGDLNCGLSLKIGEYPDFVFQLFQGLTPTEASADSLGGITTAVNKQGTSVIASTGLASVGIKTGAEGDLKFGKYVIVAKSATTVNLYCSTDADFQRGTAETFQDSTLKLVAANVTITQSMGSDITGFGLTLTGGGGTIAFVTGDTATFSLRPKNSAYMNGVLGKSGAVFPEFGCVVMAKKRGTGELFEVDCYRCKGEGFAIGMAENKWSEADIKISLMYDSVQDGYAALRLVTPLTPN